MDIKKMKTENKTEEELVKKIEELKNNPFNKYIGNRSIKMKGLKAHLLGFQQGQEEAFTNFRKDKLNWITFDDEIQKQIYYKIRDWKERGRRNSRTFFTDSIFRRIAELLETEREEARKEFLEFLESWLSIFAIDNTCKFCEAHKSKVENKIKQLQEEK